VYQGYSHSTSTMSVPLDPNLVRGFWLAAVTLVALSCGGDSGASTDPLTAGTAAATGAGTSAAAGGAGASGSAGRATATGGRTASAGTASPAGAGGARATNMAGTGVATTGGAGGVDSPAGAGGMGTAGDAAAGSGGGASPEPMGPLFPANGAENVCADPPLRMHFAGAPRVGASGKIQVFDAAAPNSPVATVDVAVMSVSVTVGGTPLRLPRPVHVDGDNVIVRLPPRALAYGKHYYVTVDSGAVLAPDGTAKAITQKTDWTFATAAAAPTDLTNVRVAIDGTGQFCSVQGALDAVPARNTAASKITIGKGTYFEIIHVAGKSNITLSGADRKQTIILGVNNETLNSGTATRALVGIDDSRGFIVENLTIKNLTPQGGSQAEALRMQKCDQCVVRHADIISLQDTLLWSGRIYAVDSYIEGNVDFVWGTGAAFFDHCEIKTVGRAGYVVQARNDTAGYGYVFVDSKITAGAGISNIILGRIDVSVYPGSQVAYINCQMGGHVAPAGWTITGGGAGASLRFWEYQSTDAAGAPLDVSRRIAGSKQISQAEAMKLRDPAQVLGGWTPPSG
jgi:pectin methylesterase-like acyl-CoA thioesterase